MNQLCVRNDDNSCRVLFPSAGALKEFVSKFCTLSETQVFRSVWENAMSIAIEKHPGLNVDDISTCVWQPCFKECKELLTSFASLTMKLIDVDRYLKPCQSSLDTEICAFFHGWSKCTHEEFIQEDVELAIERVKQYWEFCCYREGAILFLNIRNSLGLMKGDFKIVEELSREVKRIS